MKQSEGQHGFSYIKLQSFYRSFSIYSELQKLKCNINKNIPKSSLLFKKFLIFFFTHTVFVLENYLIICTA